AWTISPVESNVNAMLCNSRRPLVIHAGVREQRGRRLAAGRPRQHSSPPAPSLPGTGFRAQPRAGH
ncbi:MAG: hypothetical protein PVG38_00595, partial [Gammaproteobacteria bacterium]